MQRRQSHKMLQKKKQFFKNFRQTALHTYTQILNAYILAKMDAQGNCNSQRFTHIF